jgi:hypothetical protein
MPPPYRGRTSGNPEPKTEERRFDSEKLFRIALAGRSLVTCQRPEDLQRAGLFYRAHVGRCLFDQTIRLAIAPQFVSGQRIRPIISHSPAARLNSAGTSSFGIGWLCLSYSSASATAWRSAGLRVPTPSGETIVSSKGTTAASWLEPSRSTKSLACCLS